MNWKMKIMNATKKTSNAIRACKLEMILVEFCSITYKGKFLNRWKYMNRFNGHVDADDT